ncbi:MAG: DUF4249 domain-containing protein [Verrucomicrobia bacterium]|nr:DUF4249 domain-containing protein [Prolixibacteraceae bacterium]
MKKQIYLILIALAGIFSSCEDVIDVDLSEENLNLVGVEANITTQDEPTVFLYRTLKVNQDEGLPGISGAQVVITDDASPSNQITLVEDSQKKGLYTVAQGASFKGVAGREYTLTIQTPETTLMAKEKLTAVEPIDSIIVEPSLRGDKLFLAVFSYGQETPGKGNYYKWDIYVNDTLKYESDRMTIASDELVDGNYVRKLELFTDFHDPDKPEERELRLNDKVHVKQTSISRFGYYFYLQMINQGSTGSLFSVPPANIKSNFSSTDGKPVLGLFVARDVSVSNIIVIDQKIEDQLKKR